MKIMKGPKVYLITAFKVYFNTIVDVFFFQLGAFSLFSVVSFDNLQCQTNMESKMFGICFTAEECSSKGGIASGNCASGFGVCCFFR